LEGLGVGVGVSLFNTVIALSGHNPVAFQPLTILAAVRAFSLALMYIAVHSTLGILPESSLAAGSVSAAKALFRGAKMLTSSG